MQCHTSFTLTSAFILPSPYSLRSFNYKLNLIDNTVRLLKHFPNLIDLINAKQPLLQIYHVCIHSCGALRFVPLIVHHSTTNSLAEPAIRQALEQKTPLSKCLAVQPHLQPPQPPVSRPASSKGMSKVASHALRVTAAGVNVACVLSCNGILHGLKERMKPHQGDLVFQPVASF